MSKLVLFAGIWLITVGIAGLCFVAAFGPSTYIAMTHARSP